MSEGHERRRSGNQVELVTRIRQGEDKSILTSPFLRSRGLSLGGLRQKTETPPKRLVSQLRRVAPNKLTWGKTAAA
jgi:hypothetical protein